MDIYLVVTILDHALKNEVRESCSETTWHFWRDVLILSDGEVEDDNLSEVDGCRKERMQILL